MIGFLLALSLLLTTNAFKLQSDAYIDSANLTEGCTKALKIDLECDKNARMLGKSSYAGWIGSNQLADAICTTTCFDSLQNWNETVTKDCAKDRNASDSRVLQGLITEASEISLMWNTTCIRDTDSGRYCLDIMDENHVVADGDFQPYNETCHPCYGMAVTALLNSSMEAHLWSLDDDYWKGQLELLQKKCGGADKIQQDFIKQKAYNASHEPISVTRPDPKSLISEATFLTVDPLGGIRVAAFAYGGRTKRVAETQLEDTELVRKARAAGMSDENIIETTTKLSELLKSDIGPDIMQKCIPEGYKSQKKHKSDGPSGRDLLEFAQHDTLADVVGSRPLSSVNHLDVTFLLLMFSMKLKGCLKAAGNNSYREAYERPGPWQKEKRVSLTILALAEGDEECLKAVAEILEESRSGFMDYIYWEDLEIEPRKKGQDDNPISGDASTVM
ncbi:hypothetical protein FLONG3_542 [Fusarium longipes]|uniref:Uncharacterized protein n=1 Tax=Fusarium longipes TaxID=694270 RepID=A0A395T9N2_9HYPO|nr:hypothetical protein FLONG3_542 [Fusarium longipes]